MEAPDERNKFVGGKGAPGVFRKIINLIPPHQVFIEAFAGQAVITKNIRPAAETILVDKNRWAAIDDVIRGRPGTSFVRGDAIGFLDNYRWKGCEFVYADPPYLLAARAQRGRAYYLHEMSDRDHARLLRVLTSINCRVLLSGYRSPLYDRELSTWSTRQFEVMTRGGTKATEVLWWNYPTPIELHDYRYVGDDWHARTRLRKKITRAVVDLVSMPPLERGAMFAALAAAMRYPLAGTGERARAISSSLANAGE